MNRITQLILFLFITNIIVAQVPNKMTYQAVIRNSTNNIISNAPIKIKISIIQGNTNGISVYSELHSVTTNTNGLVSIEIGSGTSQSGNFNTIAWGNSTFYLKTEADPANGTNYTVIGISQLLTVPYAFFADSANNVRNLNKDIDFKRIRTLLYINSL